MCGCVWKHLICHRRLKRHCVSWVCHPSPKGSGEACHLLSPIPTCHRDAPNLMVCGSHHPARFETVMWISILGQVYNILTVIYSSHMFTFFIFRGQELTLALFLYSGTATVVLILSSHKLVRINYNQLRQELKLQTYDSNMFGTCSKCQRIPNSSDWPDWPSCFALFGSCEPWMMLNCDRLRCSTLNMLAMVRRDRLLWFMSPCAMRLWGRFPLWFGACAQQCRGAVAQWYPVTSSDSEKQKSTREELEKNSLYSHVFPVETFVGFCQLLL